jgi:hypothetical protein
MRPPVLRPRGSHYKVPTKAPTNAAAEEGAAADDAACCC